MVVVVEGLDSSKVEDLEGSEGLLNSSSSKWEDSEHLDKEEDLEVEDKEEEVVVLEVGSKVAVVGSGSKEEGDLVEEEVLEVVEVLVNRHSMKEDLVSKDEMVVVEVEEGLDNSDRPKEDSTTTTTTMVVVVVVVVVVVTSLLASFLWKASVAMGPTASFRISSNSNNNIISHRKKRFRPCRVLSRTCRGRASWPTWRLARQPALLLLLRLLRLRLWSWLRRREWAIWMRGVRSSSCLERFQSLPQRQRCVTE